MRGMTTLRRRPRFASPLVLALVVGCAASGGDRSAPVPRVVPIALSASGARVAGDQLPAVFSETYVFLRATIGGRPALLLFDSGAGSTMLSRELVERLGLAARGRRVTFGLGTTAVQATEHEGVTLRLGRSEVAIPSVLTWPNADLPLVGAVRASGIVGADLLRARVLEVDWQDEAVFAWDTSAAVVAREGDQVLPIHIAQGLPVVSLRAHSRGAQDSIEAVIDYGSSAAVILDGSSDAARRVGATLRDVRMRRVIGVGGAVDGPEGRLDSLALGRQMMRGALAFVDTAGVRTVSLANAQALVGTEVLRRFSVVLDYPRERVVLRPTRRVQAPFCRNVAGICFERAPGASPRVAFLDPRSPAARAGLTVGDAMITLNAVPLTEMSDREIDVRLDATGVVHLMEVRRGPTTSTGRAPPVVAPLPGRGTRVPPAVSRPATTITIRWQQ